ncbi:tRNA guanosine(34) transglycosylase Tgt [Candidatus Daviesbacteria bacterium]|nr:tRNA guanosine(34) transglycosylase Tgt [Candidatus Daviesbacteria bacterium]
MGVKSFKILQQDGNARAGKLTTPHGIIETPEFNPVGTQATVKALTVEHLQEIGVQMVLVNTYHLMLRPGAEVIKKFGGLHKFMGWDRPIMTDSGGFQVFSLGGGMEEGASKVVSSKKGHNREMPRPRLNQITEEGMVFQSHLDGSRHVLSPEISMKLQCELGADLIVAFDDHEYKGDLAHLKKSLVLTEQWALRSIQTFTKLKSKQLMYGIVHGGTNKALRIKSAKFTDKNFPAIALGGIYGTKREMYEMIDYVLMQVSDEKPRHLLGIGEIEDLFNAVERGVDLFDCVAPTRRARNGSLYVCPKCGGKLKNNFAVSIGLSKFTGVLDPIDPHCNCYTCLNFSKAYLRHLYFAKEILYHSLASYHNVYFITNLMHDIRNAIKAGLFQKFKNKYMGT